MSVAFCGLGKLGLPVACAFASRGHLVSGYDISRERVEQLIKGESGLYEPEIDALMTQQIESGRLELCFDVATAIRDAEIIFVAVQTPSLPDHSFDTSCVKQALTEIADIIEDEGLTQKTIAVISTVLPGTCRNEFLSLLVGKLGPPGERWGLVYNAQFIAMGSVVKDALNPEFVLIGEWEHDSAAGERVEKFYQETLGGYSRGVTFTSPTIVRTSFENAEVIKCAYNNLISLKVVYANTIMEMCDRIPFADCDVVSDTLSLATQRLISPRYLKGGLSDSGPCHPRDNRALSWLARKLDLSVDPFEFVSNARLRHTDRLAAKVFVVHDKYRYPIKILGMTFKPHTNLKDDSPSVLLAERLNAQGLGAAFYDPVLANYAGAKNDLHPYIYIIGTTWPEFETYPYYPKSAIIDPWGFLKEAPAECELISVGRQRG